MPKINYLKLMVDGLLNSDNIDDNFDFSGLPKLGRPFKTGAPRDKYIKFYMSEDELKQYKRSISKLSKIFQKNGFVFNNPDFFRLFIKYQDHPIILKLFFEDLAKNGFGDGSFKSSLK